MPINFAFSYGECEIRCTPAGGVETVVAFADDLSMTRKPELLEDGSAAYFIDTLTFSSPWVDSDVETFFKNRGPFKVYGYWTNVDDLRLASAGVQDARLTSARHEGTEVRRYTFELEAFALG